MKLEPSRNHCWWRAAASTLVIGLAAIAGCNSTSGGLISSLPVEIGGAARDAGGPMYFATQRGWQVELDQGVVAVGPFYFNVSPPNTQGGQSGVVIMQVTAQQFVNLLDPTLYRVTTSANGQTGTAVSVEVDLFPPGCAGGGPGGNDVCSSDSTPITTYENLISESPEFILENNGLASGSSAFVSGTAQEAVDGGNVVVPFYGFITIDESTGGNENDPAAAPLNSLQRVAGASVCQNGESNTQGCSLDFTSQPSILQIRVDPTHWFDGVDFASLIPSPPACAGTSDAGCDAGPAWSPDAGALTWNAHGTDSAFNTELVEEGLQSADGIYFFNLVPQTSNGSLQE